MQTNETKNYLKDVIMEVEKRGGYRVNSRILQEYDTNRDGIISRAELAKIRLHISA